MMANHFRQVAQKIKAAKSNNGSTTKATARPMARTTGRPMARIGRTIANKVKFK